MPRRPAEAQIRALTTDERRQLHARGLRIGRAAVYFPALLRPAGVRLRALLWTTMHGGSGNALPAPGQTSLALPPAADARFFAAIGFFPFGRRAVRIDMAERLLAQAEKAARQRLTVPPSMLASPIGCPVDDLPGILAALGYAAEYGPDGLVLRRATRPSFRKRRRQSAPRVAAAATACSSADLATLNPLP
jgi:ATP-dependent RNA helicase SUPV3L1/SUV3